jgi:hypothetical protein
MSQAEFLAWRRFYRHFPFDDLHRFHRPAAVLACSHPAIAEPDEVYERRLRFLAPGFDAASGVTDADRNTMRAFGFRSRRDMKKG